MTPHIDIGTLEIQPDPVALEALARRRDDQRELFRMAAVRCLEAHSQGRKLSPEALADARRWAAYPPLMRPLGTGEPT